MGGFFGQLKSARIAGPDSLNTSAAIQGLGNRFFGQPKAAVIAPSGNWTEASFEAATGGIIGNFPSGIANTPGKLLCTATSGVPVYSVDGGTTWTSSSTLIGDSGVGVAFEAGNFAAEGGGTQQLYYSTDGGVTWHFSHFFSGTAASAIISNGANLMVLLFQGALAGGNYATSNDHGVTWAQHTTFTGAAGWGNSNVQNVALWDGTQFVALATATGTGNPIICTSTDGIHWTAFPFLAGGTQSITFGASIYMGCNGIDGNVYNAATPGGIASASPIATGLPAPPVQSLLYDGVAFYAFDTQAHAARSMDGTTWVLEETHIPHVIGNAITVCGFDSVNKTVVAFTGNGASSGHPYSIRSGL